MKAATFSYISNCALTLEGTQLKVVTKYLNNWWTRPSWQLYNICWRTLPLESTKMSLITYPSIIMGYPSTSWSRRLPKLTGKISTLSNLKQPPQVVLNGNTDGYDRYLRALWRSQIKQQTTMVTLVIHPLIWDSRCVSKIDKDNRVSLDYVPKQVNLSPSRLRMIIKLNEKNTGNLAFH